jgi:hypothetical protein
VTVDALADAATPTVNHAVIPTPTATTPRVRAAFASLIERMG